MFLLIKQKSLVKLVRRRIRLEIEDRKFSIFNQDQKSTKELRKEFTLFLWSHLSLDVLRRFPNARKCITEVFLDVCKRYCKSNTTDLEEINRFPTTYEPERNPVSWYIKNNFVHRILSEALRVGKIGYLYSFRFFIVDLSEQSKRQRLMNNGILTVYRGQRISQQNLDRYKSNVHSHVATNCFLSTSCNREFATLLLYPRLSKTSSTQSVSFMITADSALNVLYVLIFKNKAKSQMNVKFYLLFRLYFKLMKCILMRKI